MNINDEKLEAMSKKVANVMGVHEVFEPSAKVQRKHCWNTGDEDANSNREYVEGGVQSFQVREGSP